ncbi:MAG: UPF0175 family protein [Phormidesmis sp.]
MSVTIPDSVLTSARLSESELKQEIAIMLFQQERLTLAQASSLASMKRLAFQRLLGSRHIPIYDVADFEQDIENLKALGRL